MDKGKSADVDENRIPGDGVKNIPAVCRPLIPASTEGWIKLVLILVIPTPVVTPG